MHSLDSSGRSCLNIFAKRHSPLCVVCPNLRKRYILQEVSDHLISCVRRAVRSWLDLRPERSQWLNVLVDLHRRTYPGQSSPTAAAAGD